jgi:hypothetical protein
MTDRDPEPLEFDELEPLPEETEPEVLEVDALEALPEEPAAPAPEPATAPEPKPAPAPRPSATPMAAEPAKAGAAPVPPPAPAGRARRARSAGEEEARPRPKKSNWERWPGPGEKPSRDMEQAPTILRKAALGLMVGCLLPWGGVTEAWIGNAGEKLLVIGGLFLWHQAHLLRDGAKVSGITASLGKSSFAPLFALAGLLGLLGFLPVLSWSVTFSDLANNSGPFAEKGFLILAGLTWTHIYDYEHGGKFNPMFPLMFLAPAIAGLMALLKVFSGDIGIGAILGGLGAVPVSGAGWMAAYTMYVALKEAKAHGEAKRAQQAEARKAARAARRDR